MRLICVYPFICLMEVSKVGNAGGVLRATMRFGVAEKSDETSWLYETQYPVQSISGAGR